MQKKRKHNSILVLLLMIALMFNGAIGFAFAETDVDAGDGETPTEEGEEAAGDETPEVHFKPYAGTVVMFGKTTTEGLRLRADTSTSSSIISQFSKGSTIEIIGEKADSSNVIWYKTTNSAGKVGYVYGPNVSLSADNDLNLRKTVGGEGEVAFAIAAGAEITIVELDNEANKDAAGTQWYLVRTNEEDESARQQGYISSKFVKVGECLEPEPPVIEDPEVPEEPEEEEDEIENWTAKTIRSGYTKTEGLNIRADAGTSYKSLGQVSKGSRLTILGTKKDSSGRTWYNVKNSSLTGYCAGYDKGEYFVEDTDMKLREAVGKDAAVLRELAENTPLIVLVRKSEKYVDANGVQWCMVTTTEENEEDRTVGFISSRYIEIDYSYVYDQAFEDYLTAQGFPESYKESLRTLHGRYPKWVFTAFKTGIDWTYAVTKEATPKKSQAIKLVLTTSPESYRSVLRYGYSLEAGTDYDYEGYVPRVDGRTYYGASESACAYYMDPRNWLTTSGIFQFLNLAYDENAQTLDGLKSMLKGTFMEGKFPESTHETWADAIMEAAKISGVSPYELASKIIMEVGRQGSTIVSGTVKGYEGYYNFYNIGAAGTDAVKKGLERAKTAGWNTRYKAILGGAEWYAKGYIAANQNTKYFVMWNTSNGKNNVAVHQYATYIGGASTEGSIVKSAYSSFMDCPLVFSIPVYTGMPEEASPKPSSTGNNLYYLKNLEVKGFTLDSAFSYYDTSYELIVHDSVNEIEVEALAYAEDAKVEGAGTITLNETGTTTIEIVVTASAGPTKTYTLVVAKSSAGQKPVFPEEPENPGTDPENPGTEPENPGTDPENPGTDPENPGTEPEPEEPADPTAFNLSSSSYKLGEYLTGVSPGTTLDAFKAKISVRNGSYKILDKTGKEVTSGNIATGMTVLGYDNKGAEKCSYSVLIMGDITGDGKINSTDVLMLQKYLVGTAKVDGVALKACDVIKDSKVNSTDVLAIQKYNVGKYKIVQ